MLITLILSVIMMAALFLMLIAGVAFIQDKKYFTSAPKEVQEVIQPREQKFPGQHLIGWILMIVSLLLLILSLFYAGFDGIQKEFSYVEFLIRYVIMFVLLKAFDILFFDLFLLCHSNFYSHFYPECKDVLGPQLFGFNKKSHVVQIILLMIVAAALSGICMIF